MISDSPKTQSLAEPTDPTIPRAIPPTSQRQSITRWWWLTALCAAVAIGIAGWSWLTRGIQIQVHFSDGQGLRAESRLMHRGIEVGVVERVALNPSLDQVNTIIRLNESASALACEGSRFWIERPIASTQGVRSLETLISGRYVAVEPGPEATKRQRVFQGLDQPPQALIPAGALEIILEANDRHGLQANAPVIYRGLEVGRIQSVGLSADSRWIQIRAMIEENYRTLVRENSRFWNRSGFRVDVGISGVEIDAESLASIAIGGVEFATPDSPAAEVKSGRRFELAAKGESAWTAWRPRLLYGSVLSKELNTTLSPIRLSQLWQESLFGFRQHQSRRGWILLLSDDTAIGPRDLITPSPKAIANTTIWEAAGGEHHPTLMNMKENGASEESNAEASSLVARFSIPSLSIDGPRWPVDRLSGPLEMANDASRLWIAGDIPSRWIPVETHQRTLLKDGNWLLSPSLGITVDQHGAPAFDAKSNRIVGLVIVDRHTAKIVSLMPLEKP